MLQSLDEMSRYCGGSNPAEYMEIHDRRTARLLAYIPFPERPLLLDIQFSTDYRSSVIWSRHRRAITKKTRLPLLSKCDEHRDIERGRDEDVPRVSIGAVTLSCTSRRRQGHQYEPYWLPNTLHSSGWSDVSDATSTTEADLSTSSAVFAHFTTSWFSFHLLQLCLPLHAVWMFLHCIKFLHLLVTILCINHDPSVLRIDVTTDISLFSPRYSRCKDVIKYCDRRSKYLRSWVLAAH